MSTGKILSSLCSICKLEIKNAYLWKHSQHLRDDFSVICADWTTVPGQPPTNTVKHTTASLFKAGVSQLQYERNLAVAFMNKVLLDHCHTHSFMLHWWLSAGLKTQLSDRNKDHMACKAYGTEPSGSSEEKFENLYFRDRSA